MEPHVIAGYAGVALFAGIAGLRVVMDELRLRRARAQNLRCTAGQTRNISDSVHTKSCLLQRSLCRTTAQNPLMMP